MNYELGFRLVSGYIVLSDEREPSDQTVLMDGGDAIQRRNGSELSREPSDQTDLETRFRLILKVSGRVQPKESC